MKRVIFLFILVFSCATKKEAVKGSEDPDKMLSVYHKLIEGIKYRNYEAIMSCYASDAYYRFDENTGDKYICFNNQKKTDGIQNIKAQYDFMFRNNILDRIEFEIVKIDPDKKNPNIVYLNVWQNFDDDVVEILEFKKIQNKYYISGHTVKKEEK